MKTIESIISELTARQEFAKYKMAVCKQVGNKVSEAHHSGRYSGIGEASDLLRMMVEEKAA